MLVQQVQLLLSIGVKKPYFSEYGLDNRTVTDSRLLLPTKNAREEYSPAKMLALALRNIKAIKNILNPLWLKFCPNNKIPSGSSLEEELNHVSTYLYWKTKEDKKKNLIVVPSDSSNDDEEDDDKENDDKDDDDDDNNADESQRFAEVGQYP